MISITMLVLMIVFNVDLPFLRYISDIFLFPAILIFSWGLDKAVDNTLWFNLLFVGTYIFFWPLVISLLIFIITRKKT